MKLNRIATYISILLLMVSLSSCEKWLEEDNKSDFTLDNFFVDEVSLQAGLTGVYARLQSLYNGIAHGVGQLGTDELMTTRLSNYRGVLDQYEYTSSDMAVQAAWETNYSIIMNANLIISRAPLTPDVPLANVQRIVAQAKFLRAFAYFRLVQYFGAVPILSDELTAFDYSLSRSPIKEVYQLIIDDLTFGLQESYLPKEKIGTGVNYWVAQSLLGKVYATMASAKYAGKVPGYQDIDQSVAALYKQAKVHLNEVMQSGLYDLEPIYGDVFLIANKNVNKESIFEIQYMQQSGFGSSWSKDLGVFGRAYTNSHLVNAMTGVTAVKVVPSFWRHFKTGDVRRTWSIADYWIQFANNSTPVPTGKTLLTTLRTTLPDGTNAAVDLSQDVHLVNNNVLTYMGISKYRWGEGPNPDEYWNQPMRYAVEQSPNNVIVLRYADVLLLYIEADMGEDGDMDNGISTAALTILNGKILYRARGNRLPTTNFPNFTASTFKLDDLVDERGREFCFEFQRWTDLARFGKLKDRVARRIHNTSVSNGGVPYIVDKFDESKHYLFPIPQRERNLSLNKEGFYQNPGYSDAQ